MQTKKTKEQTPAEKIELIEGKGAGHEHLFYWHIYADGVRAGQVYINEADDPALGKHASVSIFLNKTSQGRGIGRVGYREACLNSGLNKVYAHMKKSNIMSKQAAFAAGFKEIDNMTFPQLVLVWERPA